MKIAPTMPIVHPVFIVLLLRLMEVKLRVAANAIKVSLMELKSRQEAC